MSGSVFNARLAQANLITKTDSEAKLLSVNRKITANKSKQHLLVENELKNLKTFDLSCFRGKNYFENDGTQNYLVFQPMYKYFKTTPTTHTILSRKSKGLSDETIKPSRPHTVLVLELSFVGRKTRVYNLMEVVRNKVKLHLLMEKL